MNLKECQEMMKAQQRKIRNVEKEFQHERTKLKEFEQLEKELLEQDKRFRMGDILKFTSEFGCSNHGFIVSGGEDELVIINQSGRRYTRPFKNNEFNIDTKGKYLNQHLINRQLWGTYEIEKVGTISDLLPKTPPIPAGY